MRLRILKCKTLIREKLALSLSKGSWLVCPQKMPAEIEERMKVCIKKLSQKAFCANRRNQNMAQAS